MAVLKNLIPKSSDISSNEDIILRQITDHIFQCLNRIEENIEYIVFIRKNSNIRNMSEFFYVQQLDRFSRDTLITFNHILDKDPKGNTLHSLLLKIKDKKIRKSLELQLEKLRLDAQIIICHRNKIVAHHETDYNSKLGDWYPLQTFNYIYIINPCHCNRVRLKIEKLFWRLKSALNIEGLGMLHFSGSRRMEDIFKTKILGVKEDSKKGLVIVHNCRYKDCLLK